LKSLGCFVAALPRHVLLFFGFEEEGDDARALFPARGAEPFSACAGLAKNDATTTTRRRKTIGIVVFFPSRFRLPRGDEDDATTSRRIVRGKNSLSFFSLSFLFAGERARRKRFLFVLDFLPPTKEGFRVQKFRVLNPTEGQKKGLPFSTTRTRRKSPLVKHTIHSRRHCLRRRSKISS
jgi:hypothetical protein